MSEGFDFTVIWTNLAHFLIGRYPNGPIGGIALTLYLAVVALIFSFLGGMILGLLCVSGHRFIRYPTLVVVNVIRGIPLMMVIFWMYFLLPFLLNRPAPESWTVIAALSIFTSAYMSQIVEAGIKGIPRGQIEAAISTGLRPYQAMIHVVLPQALRNMIPSFVNQFVSMIKDTSLAFIVGVSELTHVATQVNNRTMIYPTEIFFFVACIYFILCFAFTSLSRRLERRLSY
jgi:polar amino acid transport system permease protein